MDTIGTRSCEEGWQGDEKEGKIWVGRAGRGRSWYTVNHVNKKALLFPRQVITMYSYEVAYGSES